MILQRMLFSEKAKVASVRPIFKKNDHEKIDNYMLVSILNWFMKSFFLKSLNHL